MGDMMTFPATVEEFMEQYKMTDTEHVYSNGTEFVPIYRMKQWFEHCRHQQRPTIDAVLVVRCENCKYGYPCGDEIVCYHPEYELAEGKWSYKKDFFCAFGDTKEGADNV